MCCFVFCGQLTVDVIERNYCYLFLFVCDCFEKA
jgi:hypothetical protein